MPSRRPFLWIALLLAAASSQVAAAGVVDEQETPSAAQPGPTSPPLPVQHPFYQLQGRAVSNSSAASSSVSIPDSAADGGLTYTQPSNTDAVSYYKIYSSNAITWGWNLTSLYVTPTSLTFIAYCSANSNTYPIGSVAAAETSIVWDPYAYQESTANAIPFAQASYTLRVFDERGESAAATAGYFYGSNSIVNFALYSPAAYTPLASGWTCVACSYAPSLSVLSHPIVVALPVTVALMLIGGAGVLNR